MYVGIILIEMFKFKKKFSTFSPHTNMFYICFQPFNNVQYFKSARGDDKEYRNYEIDISCLVSVSMHLSYSEYNDSMVHFHLHYLGMFLSVMPHIERILQ